MKNTTDMTSVHITSKLPLYKVCLISITVLLKAIIYKTNNDNNNFLLLLLKAVIKIIHNKFIQLAYTQGHYYPGLLPS